MVQPSFANLSGQEDRGAV